MRPEPGERAGYCIVAFYHGLAGGAKVLTGCSLEHANGDIAISDFAMYNAAIAQHNGKHSSLAEGVAGLSSILP